MRARLAIVPLLLSLACLVVAGCGQTTTKGGAASANGTTTPLATTVPTATTETTTMPPTPTGLLGQCFGYGADQAGTTTQVGDILFTQVRVGGLAYPFQKLPEGTDLAKPYKLASTGTDAIPNSPITNPGLDGAGGGFMLGVCNTSATKTHTLQAVTAKISAFTAYSGQLSQWNVCDPTVDSHHTIGGGGCGGAIAGCMCFHAPFAASAGAGSEVTMTQTEDSLNTPGDHAGKLPLTLVPHKGFFLLAGMDKPSAAGTYTFTFGVRIDGQSTVLHAGASPVVLLAPVAHHWDGSGCQKNAAMLSQITPTSPETYYICPES